MTTTRKSPNSNLPDYSQNSVIDIDLYVKCLFNGTGGGEIVFTPEKQQVFLKHLLKTGNISASCQAAGINRDTVSKHRNKNEDFKRMMGEVLDASIDRLEQEAFRRAYTGVTKPIYQGGKCVGNIQEYSDTLLVTLLKAHLPKYQKIDLEVEDPKGDRFKVIDVTKLPTELLEQLETYILQNQNQEPVPEIPCSVSAVAKL
jgi:hypothetical protein